MSNNFDKRPTLVEKFQKLLSLGIWSPNLSQPDPQVLERIQRLNEEIEKRIYDLYLPDGDQTKFLEQIKQQMHVESLRRREREDIFSFPLDWEHFRRTNFVHLGEGVSSWLNNQKTDTELLEQKNLPVISNAEDLKDLLKMSIQQIKWYAYHGKTAPVLTYTDFNIAKVAGGYRHISRPNKDLMRVQRIILREILEQIRFPEYVTGFIKKRDIYQNARMHSRGEIIVNIDIKDFFHSVRFHQVRSVFKKLGYSGEISTTLALLCTKQEAKEVQIDGRIVYSMSNHRYLPQGAPTSPLIANLVASKIDSQMKKRSEKMGFLYSRYADDITFSTREEDVDLKALLYMARKTLELHGFQANESKTKIMFNWDQQEVTGLVINSGNPKVPRKWRRRLRAAIHQFQFIEDEEQMADEYQRIKGALQFLKLSHPQKVYEYERQLQRYYTTP